MSSMNFSMSLTSNFFICSLIVTLSGVMNKSTTSNILSLHPQAGNLLSLRSFMSDSKSYFAHPSAVIDEGCSIGKGTKIWHFTHVMSGAIIGEHCNLGQNVVVSPEVVLGKNVK